MVLKDLIKKIRDLMDLIKNIISKNTLLIKKRFRNFYLYMV